MLSNLRKRHPEVWEDLGSPTLINNNTIRNGLRVQKFLLKKEYKGLNDPEFEKQADSLRTFGTFYLGFFILVFVLIATSIISG